MAISLKNVDDRVTELEGKIANSGGIVESKLSVPGYVKFANGFMMNWGNSGVYSGYQIKTVTLPKPHSNSTYIVIAYNMWTTRDNFYSYQPHSQTNSSFKLRCQDNAGSSNGNVHWITIGYLISNRILNRVYAYVKSLRDFKAVIKSHFFCYISNISREVI